MLFILFTFIASPEHTSQEYIKKIARAVPELGKYFTLKDEIGKGTFSRVYRAKLNKDLSKEYALKCITPTIKWNKVADELRYLRDLGGDSNIIGVKTCFIGNGYTVIVMPFFKRDSFLEVIKDIAGWEVKDYMKNLIIALSKVHKHGVIHRDVKPTNFLYNRKLKLYGLVDFGLAQDQKNLLKAAKIRQALHNREMQRGKSNQSVAKRTVLKDLTKTNTNQAIIQQDTMNPRIIKKRSFDAMSNYKQDGIPKKFKGDDPTVPETPPKKEKQKMPEAKPKVPMRSFTSVTPCDCFDKPQICGNCSSRRDLQAPRAGTPGFRPPEVLLRYLEQTTAVDMWSAGVIFASLLTRRYPFFRHASDETSLAEMITLLGSERMLTAACRLKRTITISPKHRPPIDFKILCERLRGNIAMDINDSAYDLLNRLLEPDPYLRISAADALNHPFFR